MNYRLHIGSGIPVVLLHGWGGSLKSFEYCEKWFADRGRTVINIDLLGFGESEMPKSTYTIFDYASDIGNLLDKLGYNVYYLIGHSFGGRIAIILGSSQKVKKMILVDSAGIKPRRGPRFYYKTLKYKVKKRLKLNTKNLGSSDYKALHPQMRSVFVSVVNTHLNKRVKAIKASTLIVWGSKDKDTPLYMAKYLNRHIKDSGLVIFDGASHYSYLDRYGDFVLIADKFLYG